MDHDAACDASPPESPESADGPRRRGDPGEDPAVAKTATLGNVAVEHLRARVLRRTVEKVDPVLGRMLWSLHSRRAFERMTGFWQGLPRLRASPPRATRADPAIDEAIENNLLFGAPIIASAVACWCVAFTVPKKQILAETPKRRVILDPKINDLDWAPPPSGLSGVRHMFTDMLHYAESTDGPRRRGDVPVAAPTLDSTPSMFFMTIDGVSFFNQFGLGKQVQPFFSVLYKSRWRPYLNLPMGWRGAPAIANRTLMALCQVAGVHAVVWVDNILLYNHTLSGLLRAWARLKALFDTVRLTYRIESEPATAVDFVGINFQSLPASDPEKVRMSLTDLWLSKFRGFVQAVLKPVCPVLNLDQVQKLAGYCVWVHMVLQVPLVTMSGVLTHLSVMTSPGAPSSAELPVAAIRDTNTMVQVAARSAPLVPQRPTLCPDTLWTDSCSDGAASLWHGELQGSHSVRRWRWDTVALRAHINVKELSCLLWSLVEYQVEHASVRWVTDSQVAFSVIKNNYARSPPLVALLKLILAYCEEHDVHVLPFWVGTDYMLADAPSRDVPLCAPRCGLFPPTLSL